VTYVVIVIHGDDERDVWRVAGEYTVPPNTKLSTVERSVLEQGPDVPSLRIVPEDGPVFVQLVRADAISKPMPVRARQAVVLESVPLDEMWLLDVESINGEAGHDDPPAVER
jgi:hypothetical protein